MIDFLGQMVRLPFTVIGYLFKMLGTTAQGLERIADESFHQSLGSARPSGSRVPPPGAAPATAPVLAGGSPGPETQQQTPASGRQEQTEPREEKTEMADTNLNDDMVKLVEYTILTIQRERERLLEGPTQVIETDDLSGDAFPNARIAEWVKAHPDKAEKYDSDTLRVYYSVLARWPKEDLKYDEKTLKYDEDKVKYLGEIAQELKKQKGGK